MAWLRQGLWVGVVFSLAALPAALTQTTNARPVKVTIEEGNTPPPADEKALFALKRTLIRECVEEVLIKLEKRADR